MTVPQTACSSSAERSTIWPSAKATEGSAPCTPCSASGHQRPMPSVNTWNAVAGSASTTTSRCLGGTALMDGSFHEVHRLTGPPPLKYRPVQLRRHRPRGRCPTWKRATFRPVPSHRGPMPRGCGIEPGEGVRSISPPPLTHARIARLPKLIQTLRRRRRTPDRRRPS